MYRFIRHFIVSNTIYVYMKLLLMGYHSLNIVPTSVER
jgi:hypothetical protein